MGERGRKARVLEVHGDNDAPPWLVRWNDDDHEGRFFGPDALIEHLTDEPDRST